MNGFVNVSNDEMMEVNGGHWIVDFMGFYSVCVEIAGGVFTAGSWLFKERPDEAGSAWGINGY